MIGRASVTGWIGLAERTRTAVRVRSGVEIEMPGAEEVRPWLANQAGVGGNVVDVTSAYSDGRRL